MTTSTLSKHYHRILRLWPQDALRPISFQDATKRHLDSHILRRTVKPTENFEVPNAAQVTPPPPLDEAREIEQLNALYSLLENRYKNAYPTSEALLNPNFQPAYYANLMKEMEAASTRGWLASKWLRWSRFVRFT
ncbi:MAG: hypothetical protein M1828_003794 [Chrysothrix sp. TS-e1954]|nr:MAG: hypothetical protein M1828_003794 [Chrysothrix sp. TS-e1954]